MIRMHADAVLHVRDGFTGLPVESGSLICSLDGLVIRPVRKPNGELVLINLPKGEHSLVIECPGFQREQVDLTSSENNTQEFYVALKPSERYPFWGNVTRLLLTVTEKKKPAVNHVLWLCAIGAPECKIAQTKAEAGAVEMRLFWKGTASRLGVPGAFLLEDGDDTEVITIESLSGENGVLAAPLQKAHGRGKLLLPAQQFRTDETGAISAAFHTAGTLVWHCPKSGKSGRIELTAGENRHTMPF
jgi:hypothetical protein